MGCASGAEGEYPFYYSSITFCESVGLSVMRRQALTHTTSSREQQMQPNRSFWCQLAFRIFDKPFGFPRGCGRVITRGAKASRRNAVHVRYDTV